MSNILPTDGITPNNFGKNLQYVRNHRGLTQQMLCEYAGISYSTLTKIERGSIKAPSIFTVKIIAEALDCSIDSLFYGVADRVIDKGTRFYTMWHDNKEHGTVLSTPRPSVLSPWHILVRVRYDNPIFDPEVAGEPGHRTTLEISELQVDS